MNRNDKRMLPGYRQWVCWVVESGYHNGCHCYPSDPHHDGWGCGWYWKAQPVPCPTPRASI